MITKPCLTTIIIAFDCIIIWKTPKINTEENLFVQMFCSLKSCQSNCFAYLKIFIQKLNIQKFKFQRFKIVNSVLKLF